MVVDANALLAEARWRAKLLVPTVRSGLTGAAPWPRPSALSRAVASGAAKLYAKADLPAEIEKHLPEVAALWRLGESDLRDLLAEDYLPYLRLVDVHGIRLDEPGLGQVAARDPDDEPTARLLRLLDPALLLTRDRDLLDHGYGTVVGEQWADWTQTAVTMAAASFNAQMLGGLRLTFALGGATGSAALDLGRAHPRAALAALIAGIFGLGVLVGSSRWAGLRGGVRSFFSAVWEMYGDELNLRLQSAMAATAALASYRDRHAGPGSDVALVARTLALAQGHGLLVSEIHAIHPEIGTSRIREILALRAFTQTDRWHWVLGRPAQPAVA